MPEEHPESRSRAARGGSADESGRARIERLLRPRSVALVGASPTSRYGLRLLRNLQRRDWSGRLYGVHPRHRSVEGVPCVPRLRDLPEAVDLVVVATSAPSVAAVLDDAAVAGAGAAIVLAADVAEESARTWRTSGLAILGPNCLGYVSLAGQITAPWSIGLPERPWIGPGAGVVSQSGNLSNHLLNAPTGLRCAFVVSCGNQWGVTLPELLTWMAGEADVHVLGCIVEGVPDADQFLRAAAAAAQAGKPLVVLPLGRSALGRRAARAHTGALARDAAWWTAARRRVPFAQAGDLEEFVALLKLLEWIPNPGGRQVAFAASSGGEAGLIADLAAAADLPLPSLSATTTAELKRLLPAYLEPANPLDYGAVTWGTVEPYTGAIRALAADPSVGFVGAVQDYPGHADGVPAWETMLTGDGTAHRDTGTPIAVVTTLGGVPAEYHERAETLGVKIFCGLRPTVVALAEARRLQAQGLFPAAAPRAAGAAGGPPGPGPWNEYEAKQLLSLWGIPIPRGEVVAAGADVAAAADRIGYPVVLKRLGVAHKSEAGAVAINLGHADAVRAAAHDMERRVPPEGLRGAHWLVEAYVPDRLEWFVGGSTRTGVLTTGLGGVSVEIWRDVAPLLLDADEREIWEALRSVRAFPLLEGHRGQPPRDIEAVVAVIGRVSAFLTAHRDRVLTVDINPLLVGPVGAGALAADALLLEGGA